MIWAAVIIYCVIGISFAVGCRLGSPRYDKPSWPWTIALGVLWPVFLPIAAGGS